MADEPRGASELDELEQAARKRKRDAEYAPDDIADLDSMVQDYESRASRLREYEPADDDSKADVRQRAARKVSDDLGREIGRWGEAVGRGGERIGREFGQRFGSRFGDLGENVGREMSQFFQTPYDAGYQPQEVDSTERERTLSALAHGSVVLTMIFGLFSAGFLVPFLMFVPLLIYLNYRRRSSFIAENALQAFVMQLVGTVGWLALIVISAIIGVVLTVGLAITLVGILAIPFLWLALILFWLASVVIPVGALGFGIVGAIAALQGRVYKYPYVSRWFDRQTRSSPWRV